MKFTKNNAGFYIWDGVILDVCTVCGMSSCSAALQKEIWAFGVMESSMSHQCALADKRTSSILD